MSIFSGSESYVTLRVRPNTSIVHFFIFAVQADRKRVPRMIMKVHVIISAMETVEINVEETISRNHEIPNEIRTLLRSDSEGLLILTCFYEPVKQEFSKEFW